MNKKLMSSRSGISMLPVIIVIIVGIVAILAGVAIPKFINLTDEAKHAPSATTPPPPTPSAPKATVKAFTLTATPYKFSMSEITVNEGDTVRITLVNQGGRHDWNLDEWGAKTKVLSEGEQDTVEFTANKKGTFEYYCSVGSHRQMGMKGSFIVR